MPIYQSLSKVSDLVQAVQRQEVPVVKLEGAVVVPRPQILEMLLLWPLSLQASSALLRSPSSPFKEKISELCALRPLDRCGSI